MIKEKKEINLDLTSEEKQEITELQRNYIDAISQIGYYEVEKRKILKSLENLDKLMNDQFELIESYKLQEQEIINQLNNKYNI